MSKSESDSLIFFFCIAFVLTRWPINCCILLRREQFERPLLLVKALYPVELSIICTTISTSLMFRSCFVTFSNDLANISTSLTLGGLGASYSYLFCCSKLLITYDEPIPFTLFSACKISTSLLSSSSLF